MAKFNLILVLTIISCFAYVSTKNSIGKAEKDQVLLWVDHKQTPVYPKISNLTHEFDFDGTDRNVDRITFITYDYDTV